MEKIQLMKEKIETLEKKKIRLKKIKNKISILGNVIVDDNQIKCYIDSKSFEKYAKMHELIKLEDIKNEKIIYIFSNMIFQDYLKIIALNVDVVFENCTFNNGINVNGANLLVLKDNKYANLSKLQLPYFAKSLLTGEVDNLIISNNSSFLDINMVAQKEIDIVHSKVMPYRKDSINLKASLVNMYFSRVSDLANINSDNINYFDCSTLYENELVLSKHK